MKPFNFTDGDAFYEALIQAHDGLTEAQSHALNARLVLILANLIGDNTELQAALDAARSNTLEST
jgi:Protein of unknown function (DUF2783)